MTIQLKRYALPHILLLSLVGLAPIASQADVVVIGNTSINADSITPKQAKKLWLGKLKKLSGEKVTVVDQTEGSKVFEAFYSTVVKKKPSQLKAYWAKITFTGKGFPPKQLKDDAAIVKWVASTLGGLGYVDSSAVNSTVKSLLTAK